MSEGNYRYWKDGDLEIRTCRECKFSEFKSKEDGEWIAYLTQERVNWCYLVYLKDGKVPDCLSCINERDKEMDAKYGTA